MRFETRSILTVLGWWIGLPWWLRCTVAMLFLLGATIPYLLTGRPWVWGWVIGGVLLLFSGPSDAEKQGYNC